MSAVSGPAMWRALSDEWALFSTGTNHGRGVSRVANEIGDLVLRLGRLAYANPGWTPATTAAVSRKPAELAPTLGDLRNVLTAIHHAVDTLTHIAVTDRRCARQAAADGRVYTPTRLLPADNDIPYPYVRAPRSRITTLLDGYHLAVKTCAAATVAFDYLSLAVQTPSRVLAVSHSAIRGGKPNHGQPGPLVSPSPIRQPELGALIEDPVPPGHLEEAVRSLQLSEPALRLRAAAIDEAARGVLAEALAKVHHQATAGGDACGKPGPVQAEPRNRLPGRG